MTPEEKKLLDSHVKEIAKILYKNAPPEKLETFEGIETAVRDQVLEHVNLEMNLKIMGRLFVKDAGWLTS